MTDSTSWPPTQTLRLARLAHPGRDWKSCDGAALSAVAVIGREIGGWNMIGFNADSLDDLARVERAVLKVGIDRKDPSIMDELTDRLVEFADYQDVNEAMFATPDQRRRALIAVLDAHPEIENPAPVNGEDRA